MSVGFERDYRRNGYCIVPSALTGDELTMLSTTANALLDESVDDDGGGVLHDIGRGEDRRFLRLRHQDFDDLSAFEALRSSSALIDWTTLNGSLFRTMS